MFRAADVSGLLECMLKESEGGGASTRAAPLQLLGRDERMMDRRLFLRLTGLVAAAGALAALPAATQASTGQSVDAPVAEPFAGTGSLMYPAGTYQISGRVRLHQPVVEISGITNAQQISWAGAVGESAPVASFTSFEEFDQPWRAPAIRVRGGELLGVAVLPVDMA